MCEQTSSAFFNQTKEKYVLVQNFFKKMFEALTQMVVVISKYFDHRPKY